MKEKARKIILLLIVTYAMVRMWHWKIGFTYFTQLSNLYMALIVAVSLATGRIRPLWLYTGTVSIAATFLLFLTILGPAMPGGLLGAYAQDHYASLCLHLLAPLLSLRIFYAEGYGKRSWKKTDPLLALLPPLVYLGVILLLGRLGIRWAGGHMTAPYLFLNYGAPAGWFGFRPDTAGFFSAGIGVFYCILLLLALFLLLGRGILWLGERRKKG